MDGQPCYRLGFHWWRTLVAVRSSGEVWALAPLRPTGPLPGLVVGAAPVRVNSSVAAFVDLAWRWHRMFPILVALGGRDGFFTAAELFLARLPELDASLRDDERFPWWRDLILNW